MSEPVRVCPQEARQEVTSKLALLVCAYEDEEKCKQVNLEGSISLTQFKSDLPSISKDREIIFYCA